MRIYRGKPAGDKHRFIRIDKVHVMNDEGQWRELGGSIVVVNRNERRTARTVFGSTIIDGVKPMWLLEKNGLGALVRLRANWTKAAKR
jgi:hypothetical protein